MVQGDKMIKSRKLQALFTGTAAVMMLTGTSAFAETRHRAETQRDSPAQTQQRYDRSQTTYQRNDRSQTYNNTQRYDRSQTYNNTQRYDRSQTYNNNDRSRSEAY